MRQAEWETFSTDSVLPPQRVHRWNAYGSETLGRLTVDPCDRDVFSARLARFGFGPLGLVSMRSTGAVANSGMGGVGRWAAPDKDALLLTLPHKGRCVLEQNNVRTAVGPGDLFFRDLTRPWAHFCPDDMHQLMLKIPFSVLLSCVPDPARLVGVAFSSRQPTVALAADILRSVHRTLKAEPDGDWHDTLSDMVLDMVRMLYQGLSHEAPPPHEQPNGSTIRREAMQYIIRNLDDADMSIASVASALGIGQRRLQRAFIEAGETPSEFILTQRLDRAARKLIRPRGACRNSILDVAISVGFNDASHFSRTFTRRYGVSPRHYKGTPPI